jgi:hypothetical protein
VNGGGVQNGTPVTGTVRTGAVGPPVWYASGTGNYPLSYSTNVINWTVQNFAGCNTVGGSFQCCAYNGTVAVGSIYNGNIRYSSNFTNWTATNTSSATIGIVNINTAAYGNGVFVFCGNATTSNQFVYSSDGITWTVQALKPAYNGAYFPQSVSFHPYLNIFISGAFNGGFTYSTNGIHWTAVTGASTSATMASSSTSSTIVASWGTNTLRYSINGGQTFTLCPSLPTGFNSTNSITGISYVNGRFFASSNVGTTAGYYSIAYSVDGVNWTGLVLGTTVNPGTTQFGYTPNAGGVYTAMGNPNLYSTDGMNWTSCIAGGTNSYFSIATNLPPPPTVWVASQGGTSVYSTNAVVWTSGGSFPIGQTSLMYANGIYAACGSYNPNCFAYSTNAITWTAVTTTNNLIANVGYGIAYGKGAWLVSTNSNGGTYTLAYSSNISNWTAALPYANLAGSNNTTCLAYGNGFFLVCGVATAAGANNIAYSVDAINWTSRVLGFPIATQASNNICYGPVYFVNTNIWLSPGRGSNGNAFYYSTNGLTWTAAGNASTILYSTNGYGGASAAYGKNIYVVSGYNTSNTLAYSVDALNWTGLGKTIITGSTVGTLVYSANQGLFVVAGPFASGGLAYSVDGLNWSYATTNPMVASTYTVTTNS